MPLFAGCPTLPPPEMLEFDTDPRILRGSYSGIVDTREAPFRMALAGDGSLLATNWFGSVELWDLDPLELVATIAAPSEQGTWLSALAVDGSGSLIAGVLDGHVLVWDAHDGSLQREFDPGTRLGGCVYCGVYQMALSPTGGVVAAAGQSPLVLLVDTATGAVTHELETAGDEVGLVAFSADGTLLAAGAYLSDTRYAVRVWDTTDLGVVFEREGSVDTSRVARFAFSADGRRLAVASTSELQVFDLAGGATVLPLEGTALDWFWGLSPDGTQAAFDQPGQHGTDLVVVEVATGATLARFTTVLRGFPEWSADGRYLVAGTELVEANDFAVVHVFGIGQLHDLELTATAQFVDALWYTVTGTLSIDGGDSIAFSGTVEGNESQRYLRPLARAPFPAALEIELAGHPWRLHALQDHSRFDADSTEPGAWSGHVTVEGDDDVQEWYPLHLWRTP